MLTAIENSLPTPAVACAPRHAVRAPTPLRVLTNATLEARERLRSLGYVVEGLEASTADIDADIVVVDRSLAGAWGPLNLQKLNAPVVFINSLILLREHCASHALNETLAATFAERSKADPAEEGRCCGNLKLDGARGFWNGVDLGLTLGEYKIVELLASRPGHFFTYRAIYDRLRHEGFVAGEGVRGYWANVRSAIKRTRNKFRELDPAFAEIENYTGFGYGWRKPD